MQRQLIDLETFNWRKISQTIVTIVKIVTKNANSHSGLVKRSVVPNNRTENCTAQKNCPLKIWEWKFSGGYLVKFGEFYVFKTGDNKSILLGCRASQGSETVFYWFWLLTTEKMCLMANIDRQLSFILWKWNFLFGRCVFFENFFI